MSITSVGLSSGASAPYTSSVQQRRQEFRQLSTALNSGDLAGAQGAFATLTQDFSSNSSSPSSIASQLGDQNSPLGKDLAAVGKDLQNGDLAAAKQDFAQLQKDLKAQVGAQAGGARRHQGHAHHADNDGDDRAGASSGATVPPPASASGGTLSVTG